MTTDATLTIHGMSCGGCVASVTRVLRNTPGIEPLHVQVGQATVRIDPAQATLAAATAALERAGFRVADAHDAR